jgi:DNA-binding SARP family transcriptional activator
VQLTVLLGILSPLAAQTLGSQGTIQDLERDFLLGQATWFVVTAALAIAVYLGLAVHVVTRSPRWPISWVFGGFCLTVGSYYLSSLFLFQAPGPRLSTIPWALRWKWVAISFSPSLYLHLASFYFPPAWRRVFRWALPLAYVCSTGWALAALFTHLLVAGPLFRSPPNIIGPVPGPLIYPFLGLFAVQAVISVVGVATGYRAALSPSRRRQSLYLLIPMGLVTLSALIEWIIVLAQDGTSVPHESADALLILAGFSFAGAVLRFGSLVGRPTARRELFYSALAAAVGLAVLYLTLNLDQRLRTLTPVPYPLVTGILVIIVAISLPAVGPWIINRLDNLFFRAEAQQRAMTQHLLEALIETPDPEEMQAELLGALCAALGARGGYVALADAASPPETLTVCTVRGRIPVQAGDQVRPPPLRGAEPQLVATLTSRLPTEPGWHDMALVCPIPGTVSRGFVALADKRSRKPFTSQDLSICVELARQMGRATLIGHMHEQRNSYLEAARLHDEAVRQLEQNVTTSVRSVLTTQEQISPSPEDLPLEIRLLGPLQIIRTGQPVPEGDWGTEKAKALLAYLLWKGPRGASREEISTGLWPGRPVEETANVFHVTLHRLRRTLEPEVQGGRDWRYILYEGGRYRFNFEAPHRLDVTAFQALISKGKPEALQEAVALYRGAYLEDVDWALPPEAEWERRVMERLYEDTLRQLAAQARGGAAELYLERLLATDPADEAAQSALVTSYLARGRRDLARRQIGRWRNALVELDIAPSLPAMALWERAENRK